MTFTIHSYGASLSSHSTTHKDGGYHVPIKNDQLRAREELEHGPVRVLVRDGKVLPKPEVIAFPHD